MESLSQKRQDTRQFADLHRVLIDTTPVPMICLDSDLQFVKVNRAFMRETKKRETSFSERRFTELFPGMLDESQLRQVIRTRIPFQIERQPLDLNPDHPSGSEYYDVYLSPIGGGSQFRDCLVLTFVKSENEPKPAVQREPERSDSHGLLDAPLGYQSLDKNGRFIEVNDTWLELMGYTRDEVIDHHFSEFISADSAAEFKAKFRQFVEVDRKVRDATYEMVCKDGSHLIASFDGRVETDSEGNFRRTICILKDKTDEHAAKEELQYRLDFESLITTISNKFVNTPVQEIEAGLNRALEEVGRFADIDRSYIFLLNNDRSLASNTNEWCHEGIEPQIHNLQDLTLDTFPWIFSRILDKEEVIVPRVSELGPEAAAEKEEFEKEDIKSLVCLPLMLDDETIGLVGFDSVRAERTWPEDIVTLLRSVGDCFASAIGRRQSEMELIASEEKYRLLVENQTDLIVRIDSDYCLQYVNPRYCDTFGKEESELLGQEFFPLIHKDDREAVKESLASVAAPPHLTQHEERSLTTKGWRWFAWSARGIVDENGSVTEIVSVGRDITEKKRAEAALKESEERFRQIAENLQQILWINSPDWSEIYYISPAFERLNGIPRATIYAEPLKWTEFIIEEDRTRFTEYIKHIQATDKTRYEFPEFRVRRGDGEIRWIQAQAFPVTNEQGQALRYVGIADDITPRKAAEQALRESEERYRTMYNNTPVMMHSIDAEGHILAVSDYWLDKLGYDRSEVIGKKNVEFLSPDARKKAIDEQLPKFFERGWAQDVSTQMVRKNGEVIDVLLSATSEKDDDGNVVRSLSVMTDITERNRAEETLRLTQFSIDHAADAVCWIAPDGMITYANEVTCSSLEREKEEILTMNVSDIAPEYTAKKWKELWEEIKQLKSKTFESEIKVGDSVAFPVEMTANFVEFSDKQLICVFVRNITERRLQEKEILKAQKLQSIGVLAGGIAHDFSNILGGVLGNISLARMDLDPDGEVHKILTDAEKATIRAAGLTKRLLTFAKGGAPIKEEARIGDIVHDSAEFVLTGTNVKCEWDIADNLHLVEVDKGQFSQVIQNLTINAHQAMPEGGTVHISARNIKIAKNNPHSMRPGKYVLVAVADEGEGVPEVNQAKIFDPFFTTKPNGSGLGLATSYSVVDKHNGYIRLESTVGQGATFEIYLPASSKDIAQPTAIAEEPDDNWAETTATGSRVLMMDDELIIRNLTQKILTKAGFEVEMAKDCPEAIDMYRDALKKDAAYDVVILDLTIPGGVGGREAIKYLREMNPKVKAIVCSGYANDPVMAEFEKYGFKGAVVKPFRPAELVRTVEKIAEK